MFFFLILLIRKKDMLQYVYGNHNFSFSEPRCISNYFISVFVHFFFSDSRKLYTKKNSENSLLLSLFCHLPFSGMKDIPHSSILFF